jgi:hypothetical protein
MPGLLPHEFAAMIIAAVFARILAGDTRWFAAFEKTAHRFPCCDTLAALVAVRAW